MPVTAGLVMASAALLIETTSTEWGTAAITIVADGAVPVLPAAPVAGAGGRGGGWGRRGC